MLVNEIMALTNRDVALMESLDEIKDIVKNSIHTSTKMLAHKLNEYAARKLHSFPRDSQEFQLLSKIIANPSAAATKFMTSAMSAVPTLTQEV
jgi:hypothetical protein